MKALVEDAGALVSAVDEDGDSALGLSGAGGYDDVSRYLLERGATCDFFTAALLGHLPSVVAALDGSGGQAAVDVDARDGDGATALMGAAAKGRLDVVDLLLARGAGVDLKVPNSGLTALLLAASEGQASVSERLLAAGANPRRCVQRMNAAEVAENAGHSALADRLRRAAQKEKRRSRGRSPGKQQAEARDASAVSPKPKAGKAGKAGKADKAGESSQGVCRRGAEKRGGASTAPQGRACSECGHAFGKGAFSGQQWKKPASKRRCKACVLSSAAAASSSKKQAPPKESPAP